MLNLTEQLCRQRGVALIQVLIVSLILTTLAIYIAQTIKRQTETALQIQHAFNLRLKIENVEAILLQTLLSEQHYNDSKSFDSIVNRWNFHGKPFEYKEGVEISIQDLSSLISVNLMDKTLATSLFRTLKLSSTQSQELVDALLDWVDSDNSRRINGAESQYYRNKGIAEPRNGYIQSMAEVSFIKGAKALTPEQWRENFTTELVSGFNPLNAPRKVLNALIKADNIVNQLITMRDSGQLTRLNFFQLTGIDGDEFINFATGKRFLIKLHVNNNAQKISKQFVVALNPRSSLRPIVITDVAWNID